MTVTLRIDSIKILAAAILLAVLALALQKPSVPEIDITRPAVLDVSPQVGPVDTLNNESQTVSQPSAAQTGTVGGHSATVSHPALPSGGSGGTVINKVKYGASTSVVASGSQSQRNIQQPSTTKSDDTSNTTTHVDQSDDDLIGDGALDFPGLPPLPPLI